MSCWSCIHREAMAPITANYCYAIWTDVSDRMNESCELYEHRTCDMCEHYVGCARYNSIHRCPSAALTCRDFLRFRRC